jgi:hypothetical protein
MIAYNRTISSRECSGCVAAHVRQNAHIAGTLWLNNIFSGCFCYKRPHDNATVVRCSGALPQAPPWPTVMQDYPVALHVGPGTLSRVPNLRLVELHAPYNKITNLDVKDLPNTLRVSRNLSNANTCRIFYRANVNKHLLHFIVGRAIHAEPGYLISAGFLFLAFTHAAILPSVFIWALEIKSERYKIFAHENWSLIFSHELNNSHFWNNHSKASDWLFAFRCMHKVDNYRFYILNFQHT